MYIKSGVLYSVNLNDVVDGVLEIPEGVSRVIDGALDIIKRYSYGLEKLVIPSTLINIPNFMFTNVTTIKELEIKEGVEKIGSSAFSGCSRLSTIHLPNSLLEIEDSAFEKTNIHKVNLPKNIRLIGEHSFSGNANLKEVDLSEAKNLKVISKHTFSECRNLNYINFGENSSVREIKFEALSETGLQRIEFPNSLRSLHSSNISLMRKLRSISLNEGLEEVVGPIDVHDLPYLSQIRVPSSVKRFSATNHYENKKKDFKIVIARDGAKNIVKNNLNGKKLVLNSNHENIKALYMQNNIEIITDKDIIPFNTLEAMRVEGYDIVLSEYKADTMHLWLSELKKVLGENIKVYPKGEEIATIPVNRMQDYVKNRRIINEILKNTESLSFYTRRELLLLALNLGVLEQDNGIKNDVITIFRESVFNNPSVLSHGLGLSGLKPKSEYIYNPKYNILIKELFKNSKKDVDTRNRLVNLICEATNNFDSLIEFKRHPTQAHLENYIAASKYDIENKADLDIVQIASVFDVGKEEFSAISQSYHQSVVSPIKNFIDYAVYKTEGMEGLVEKKEKHYDLSDNQTKGFTFEWMQKDDPNNGFLGYICDSCAKIGWSGEPILTASLLQRNVQNLVVRNENGAIIAKGTAFLDYKEGIVVFNNIEANENFMGKSNQKIREDVVKTIKRGVVKMVSEYDKYAKKSGAPTIKKVNMGMLLNDFQNEFKNNDSFISADPEQYLSADFFGYPTDTMSQITLYNKNSLLAQDKERELK